MPDVRGTEASPGNIQSNGDPNPLWFKDAIIYQLHIKTFCDANNDGIGDFLGLASKLDYIKNLGVTAILLSPFYPSPLKNDGYDISDYFTVHPSYGVLDDFKYILDTAHEIELRVITELVLNHTSDQHIWFQKSRRAAVGDPWRDYYVWSDDPAKYAEARIIFKDHEVSNWTYDSVAKSYFWHRYYAHEPDLNFDNPEVHKAIIDVLDFWLDMGVDGLQLDAVPYLYEREGTDCENLAETHSFLKKLRAHVDERFENRMLLTDANMWPEDVVAYFGEGDECHMNFHFPLMPRLFIALRKEDCFPIIDILQETPQLPESCQWALFLRNHNELTLEMVTDEELDWMYRVYAWDLRARINGGIRRRLAPLLGNNRRAIELMNTLLFSLPGTPVLYYGDEIGMGDNIYLGDCNGLRTPMQWSADKNAGFSRAGPQQLYPPVIIDQEFHYEIVNVEIQEVNLSSMLWWMRRMIALRKRYLAFGRGSLKFIDSTNPKTLVFLRKYADEMILVVANLSRFPQVLRPSLLECAGMIPIELFGKIQFPDITDRPYFFSLAPYSSLLLRLEGDPAMYNSCFISYSTADTEFAERLYADLSFKGVTCWFAPEDIKIGDRFRQRIHDSIRTHDKLLLILSENSVRSPWVEDEVENALAIERREQRSLLFPVRIDDAVLRSREGWAETLRNIRHIGNFSEWKGHDAYMRSLARLLRDLKTSGT